MGDTGFCKKLSACVGLLIIAGALSMSQAYVSDGCSVLNPNAPSIEVVKDQTRHRDGKVWFKLHNNSSCTILIETNETSAASSISRMPQPQKKNGTQQGTAWQGDVFATVFYDIQDGAGESSHKPGNYSPERHLVFKLPVPPGASVTFSVERGHATSDLNLSIPFSYSWESDSGTERIEHRVFLPQGTVND